MHRHQKNNTAMLIRLHEQAHTCALTLTYIIEDACGRIHIAYTRFRIICFETVCHITCMVCLWLVFLLGESEDIFYHSLKAFFAVGYFECYLFWSSVFCKICMGRLVPTRALCGTKIFTMETCKNNQPGRYRVYFHTAFKIINNCSDITLFVHQVLAA